MRKMVIGGRETVWMICSTWSNSFPTLKSCMLQVQHYKYVVNHVLCATQFSIARPESESFGVTPIPHLCILE